jgi:hypothetical protein
VAIAPGARVRTEFEGSDVAVVGRLGPSGDPAAVRVDGGSWYRDPAAAAGASRAVLFSDELGHGRHSLEIRARADGLAVEAILILRSLRA